MFTAHLVERQVAASFVWAKNKLSHPFNTLFNFQRNVVILLDKWSPKTTRSFHPRPAGWLTGCLICNLRHLMMALAGESRLRLPSAIHPRVTKRRGGLFVPQVATMPQCDYSVQSLGTVQNAIVLLRLQVQLLHGRI